MTEAPRQPERIDLARADDPRDVVHRAVACLAGGGVVALPTGSAYGLAAVALRPEAVAQLQRIKGPAGNRPLPLGLKGVEEAIDWVPDFPELARRLARRAWPGPVTLIVPGALGQGLARRLPAEVRAMVAPGSTLALRAPAHPILREILRLTPGPLVLTGAHRDDEGPQVAAEPLVQLPGVRMVLDAGPRLPGGSATVVRVDSQGWEIVRPGVVPPESLMQMAGTVLLFVCTGNTCRSPMAEALCKRLLADRVGCPIEELENHGYFVLSAGLGAMNGLPAAAHAVEVVRSRGGSLREHLSRKVTPDLIHRADWIIAMTHDHLDALLSHVPEIAPRARLLHPLGYDVADPIGSDLATYRRTADEIESYLRHLLADLAL